MLAEQIKAGRTALLSFSAMINMLYRDRENWPGRLRRQLSTFSRIDKQARRMISGTDINIFESGS